MKRRGLSAGVALIALALFVGITGGSIRVESIPVSIALAAAGVAFTFSLMVLLTSFESGRTKSLLRLDWFAPAIRRLKPDQRASYSPVGRLMRRLIPDSLQSDWMSKQRGWIRRTLRRFGISWLASPVRRATQGFCLALFCVLFLWVCWPYDARPAPTAKLSGGWAFQEVDPSGSLVFRGGESTDWLARSGQPVYLTTAEHSHRMVSRPDADLVKLEPANELSPELFDALVTGESTWTIYDSDPSAWPSHYADNLANKEWVPAELFLIIDPLVSLSTAVASRSWVWSLASAGVILIVCVLIPRGFCGYLCPLGTTIDLFDWAVGKRVTRFRVADDGWWVHIKYYLLAGTLLCAVFGVLVSGFFSAIPVITRAGLFLIDPLQSGLTRGWHLVPAMTVGQALSIFLFFCVLGLGFFRPRFWCKYVCPSGAVFSLGNLFRVTERKVESSCINCNKCVEICPFDAIKPDFTTRTTDCTLCQSCGGVCPTHAIKFVERWNVVELKVENDPPTHETPLGRRGFLSLAAGSAAAVAGSAAVSATTKAFGAQLDDPDAVRPVRPPGSVPEQEFLEMCIRCGECFKACPNNVLQPEGFEQGLEGLWSPLVNADWAGCESSCNACGQVCPTGAIRALPLEEKKVARMGLAIVNEQTCLPFAAREGCDLCVQECNAVGYHAIEYRQVHTELDEDGVPIEGSGYSAPVVLADKCVGCGLCQTRCYAINAKEKHLLEESAIIVEAGEGKEDRLMSGSYIALREQEKQKAVIEQPKTKYRVPDDPPAETIPSGDPFGVPETPAEPDADENPFF